MHQITPQEIDYTKSYTGYLWYSDENQPRIFTTEHIKDSIFSKLPFILEGYLFSAEDGGLCLSIKNIEGDYRIHEVKLKEVNPRQIERFSFLTSSDFKSFGITKFKSLQYWSTEKDEFCEGMEVLQPTWIAFEGFEYTTKPEKS